MKITSILIIILLFLSAISSCANNTKDNGKEKPKFSVDRFLESPNKNVVVPFKHLSKPVDSLVSFSYKIIKKSDTNLCYNYAENNYQIKGIIKNITPVTQYFLINSCDPNNTFIFKRNYKKFTVRDNCFFCNISYSIKKEILPNKEYHFTSNILIKKNNNHNNIDSINIIYCPLIPNQNMDNYTVDWIKIKKGIYTLTGTKII